LKYIRECIVLLVGIALGISVVYIGMSCPWTETVKERQPVFNMEGQQIGYVEVATTKSTPVVLIEIFGAIGAMFVIIHSVSSLKEKRKDC
jgi:hypothetical protein